MPSTSLHFPAGFLWGAATAAHQVEGNNRLNDWWDWEQLPGRIFDGSRSGDACDHWNRYEQDFDLLKCLNHTSHRFSIEWSRIEPEPGQFDDVALEHYRQVIAALRARGMEPIVTLHHFTNPAWLGRSGGWTSPEAPYRFEQYVRYVLRALRGQVRYWITVNEPNVYAFSAYVKGEWPPQARSLRMGYRVIRHLLRAHALAYRAIHELDPRPDVMVGFAHNMQWYEPWSPYSPADRLGTWLHAAVSNWRFLDAFVEGRMRFPIGLGEPVPELKGTLDFLGLNYYMRLRVRFSPRLVSQGLMYLGPTPGMQTSLFGWELYPPGLFHVLQRIRRYGLPVMVTENGIAEPGDTLRPGYLVSHLAQLHRAIAAGQPILGYQHWTSTDNFEWTQGLRMRFGLIHVDFATQERTIKPSGHIYGQIAGANAIAPELLKQYGRWQRAVPISVA